jgi:serine/threonine-protein kinase RsbW
VNTEEGEVKRRIRDEGEGFDYKKVPDPTAPENIENIHGRGVFLMTRLSDGIRFNDKGTEVEMTFKI